MNKWIGPTMEFFGFNINTTAFCLGWYSLNILYKRAPRLSHSRPISTTFSMAIPGLFFVYFCSFRKNYRTKFEDFSSIRTCIVRTVNTLTSWPSPLPYNPFKRFFGHLYLIFWSFSQFNAEFKTQIGQYQVSMKSAFHWNEKNCKFIAY